jgi:hypothetical protein
MNEAVNTWKSSLDGNSELKPQALNDPVTESIGLTKGNK